MTFMELDVLRCCASRVSLLCDVDVVRSPTSASM